jgi:hypothetical protein
MTRTKAMLLDTAAVGSFFTRLAFFVLVVLPFILWNAPALATTLEERTAQDQGWVNAME